MLSPLDLVSAHSWRRATFTTYALSLSFFEAIVLDALVRGGGREALILADVDGVRASLSEQGARRVGKDYDVEPIAVTSGVFHPKISVLSGDDECHLLVGSGNLTFGGWGRNLEVIEHLHPSFAANAIADAADFFEHLASSKHVRHSAAKRCDLVAGDLRGSIRGRQRSGDIRLFHSLDGPISQKLISVAEELGGARRVTTAAPFWDGGLAISDLCTALGLSEVFVHVHEGGVVEGNAGANWPARPVPTVHAVHLDIMSEEKPRRLHAKMFEVVCRHGRVLLSGSANVTTAALGINRNVEACIARIQRRVTAGWTFVRSEPPELRVAPDQEPAEESEVSGVLRATLEDERIVGQVLTPKMNGPVTVFQLTAEGAEELGKAILEQDARFSLRAPGLELQSWRGGRLVLRIESPDGRSAEGFVSVATFAEIIRRAGPLAPRLFAVLAGTEAPADVAAIMSWFYEDPRRLVGAVPVRVGGGGDERDKSDGRGRTIAVAELNSSYAANAANRPGAESPDGTSWRRFMDHVFSAFRERRGPFGRTTAGRKGEDEDDDEDGGTDEASDSNSVDPAITRTLQVFDELFDLLLSPTNVQHHALTAFDLTQYVCERLQPQFAVAKTWLERLVDALSAVAVPLERQEAVAAAILALLVCGDEPGRARIARARLSRLGYPLSGVAPSSDSVQGFQTVLIPLSGFAEVWAQVQLIRTLHEQTRAYISALETGHQSTEYSDLPNEAPEEWPVLRDAITSQIPRDRVLVLDKWSNACPLHHRTLPKMEVSKLRTIGIATAKNCCDRILLYPGN